MSSKNVASMLAAADANRIYLKNILTRGDLDKTLSSLDGALSTELDCCMDAIKVIKYRWKTEKFDSADCDPDYGCPTSMEELKQFVKDKRYPKAEKCEPGAYLEYYTGSKYTVKTEKWLDYEGSDENDLPSEGSAFFKKNKSDGSKKAPAILWKNTAIRTRLLLGQFLGDDYIRDNFLRGFYENWGALRKNLFAAAGIDSSVKCHMRPSQLFRTCRKILSCKDPYLVKYGKFMASVSPFLIEQKDESAVVKHGDLDNTEYVFTGSEEKQPVLMLFCSILAAQHLTEAQFDVLEDAFIASKHDIGAISLAENRPKWHELCRQAVPASGVRSVAIKRDTVGGVDKGDDSDEQDEIEEQMDRVCAIWNKKFSERKFGNRRRKPEVNKFVSRHRGGDAIQHSPGSRSLLNKNGYVAKSEEYCIKCMKDKPRMVPHLKEACWTLYPEQRKSRPRGGYSGGRGGRGRGGPPGPRVNHNREDDGSGEDEDTRSVQNGINNGAF